MDGPRDFPMQWSWRFALLLPGVLGAVAAVLCALELSGLVPHGTLVTDGSRAERWFAVAFGVLVQPFVWTTLRHARLTLDDRRLTHLRFGILSRRETIPFADIRRWGTGEETNRGYRHRMLLLERHDRSRRSIKLATFRGQAEFLRELEARLGPPARTENTAVGVTFSD